MVLTKSSTRRLPGDGLASFATLVVEEVSSGKHDSSRQVQIVDSSNSAQLILFCYVGGTIDARNVTDDLFIRRTVPSDQSIDDANLNPPGASETLLKTGDGSTSNRTHLSLRAKSSGDLPIEGVDERRYCVSFINASARFSFEALIAG